MLRDVVDEPVQHHAAVVVRAASLAHGARIVGMLAGRRLADAEEDIVGHDDVDLLIEDAILVGDGDGNQEHAEDVVAVRLEGGTRLVGEERRREQKLERRLLHSLRQLRAELVGRRIDQVDPLGHRGRG